jgi:hypothetical protein
MKLAIVIALAACQQSSKPAPPPPPPTRDAMVIDATMPTVVPDAAIARTSDDDFKDMVRAYAKRRKLLLASWGTLHLDGTKKPYRYAGMVVKIDNAKYEPICDDPCAGGYIIEEAPGKLWYVATWWTAGAFHEPEGRDLPDEPSWDVLDDTWIQHDQMHNHGSEKVSFAIRGGKLVVLDDDDYNSRRDDEDIHHVYARRGVCKGKCPPMAGWSPEGIYMELLGPVAKLEDLPKPSPM